MKILNSPLNTEIIIKSQDNFANARIFNHRIYYSYKNKKDTTIISTDINGQDRKYELPQNIYIDTAINIYGGICFCPTDFGIVYSDSKTKELFIVKNHTVEQLTFDNKYNYADINYNNENKCIVFVAEQNKGHFPKQHIGQINLKTRQYSIIAKGADFYHSPKSESNKIIWLEWNLPHMPWDNSSVILYENNKTKVVSQGIGHFQPELINGDIYYAKDTGSYFNIFKNNKNISPLNIDFYMPLWVYGMRTYTVLDNKIIACGAIKGNWQIGELRQNKFIPLKTQAVYFDSLYGENNNFVTINRYSNKPSQIILNNTQIIDTNNPLPVNDDYISSPEEIEFYNNNDKVYAYYYPPKNPAKNKDNDNKPPLIVKSHSGPTGQATTEYNPKIQFWTSRGFAVLDVNYSGSTGYGSKYRNRLNNLWGEIDIQELESGAKYCVKNNLANPNQLIISGSSAGGYSVLCALTFGNVFNVGTSIYGIGNLSSLVEQTHKFEANYFDILIAPYKDNLELYKNRSPINFAQNISAPILFLQGLDDKVVSPSQSKLMYDNLIKNNIPTALINYVGEGHGFKNPETKAHALEAELQFYDYIFNNKKPNYEIGKISELDFNK